MRDTTVDLRVLVRVVHYSAYVDYERVGNGVFAHPKEHSMGSNVWSINSPKTDSLGAKMIMNPHLDYSGLFSLNYFEILRRSCDILYF